MSVPPVVHYSLGCATMALTDGSQQEGGNASECGGLGLWADAKVQDMATQLGDSHLFPLLKPGVLLAPHWAPAVVYMHFLQL